MKLVWVRRKEDFESESNIMARSAKMLTFEGLKYEYLLQTLWFSLASRMTEEHEGFSVCFILIKCEKEGNGMV